MMLNVAFASFLLAQWKNKSLFWLWRQKKKLLNTPEFKQSLTTFKFQKLGCSWSMFGSVIYLIMRENLWDLYLASEWPSVWASPLDSFPLAFHKYLIYIYSCQGLLYFAEEISVRLIAFPDAFLPFFFPQWCWTPCGSWAGAPRSCRTRSGCRSRRARPWPRWTRELGTPNSQRHWAACPRGGDPARPCLPRLLQSVHFRKDSLHHQRHCSGHPALPWEEVQVMQCCQNVWVPLQCCALSVRKNHQAQVNSAGLSPAGSNRSPSVHPYATPSVLWSVNPVHQGMCSSRGKNTSDFMKQNVLFILFSGIWFHVFYLNSENC